MNRIVKWMSCAAFFTLHFSLFTSLTSCSDDPIDTGAHSLSDLTRGYSAEQIKLQRLGYAYNAAGNVMDDSSFSVKPIISMERLEVAEDTLGPIVSSERRHYTSVDIFSGSTLQEMGHQETKYTIEEDELVASGKYYRENSTVYKGTWHSSYKAHMFIKHVMATRTIDAGMLRCLKLDELDNAESVLDADFRKDVAELVKGGDSVSVEQATKFSEKYGTHLVVSANIGGMIELQMEIQRDSCIEKEYTTTQVMEIVMGEKVINSTPPSNVITRLPKHTVKYKGEIKVKGGSSQYDSLLHKTFDDEKAAEVKIGDGNYYGWAGSINMDPANYNASFVGGRYLPLYDLFEDATTRRILRQVYEKYLKKEAPSQEVYEPDYGVMPVAGNYGPDVRVASVGTNKACIICQEYVPSIRSDKPCIVAYPLIRDKDGNERPFLYSGLFVGDESHRPGRVIWEGSSSVYTPSDSIFFENDSVNIHKLFDEKTHALKNVYFYWNAVQAQPCPTKKEEPKAYTTTIFKSLPAALSDSTAFAKVASTFWSTRPVVPKRNGTNQYWKADSMFQQFYADRYSDLDGTMYKDTTDKKNYYFCLIDGGDNIKRVPVRTNDNDGNLQWTDAVSQSVKAIGLNDLLPTVEESKSITRMLGNRMSIFYSHEWDGRNMLGLDWPTGYWVISHPSQLTMAVTPQHNDGQGMPVVTNDAGQARILRLSGSGTDLLLEYPEYVRAFNYSDQEFFKFFPLYITTKTF